MQPLRQKIYTLLRKSEAFFKTDMVYLAKGGFWLTAGQTIGSLASFCLAIILARYLSKETYGTYKYILSIAGALTLFSLKGMDAAMVQAVAHNHDGSFLKVLKAKIYYGLIGSLIAFGMAVYYWMHQNTLLEISFIIVGLFIAISDPLFLYDTLLQGKQKFKTSTIYSTITQVIAAGLIGVTAMVSKNVLVLLFVYFSAWTFLRLFFLLRVLRTETLNTNEDPKLISYGIHTSVINSIATLSGTIDSILIFHYLGPVQLAIYTFALAPVSQIRMFTDKIPTLAMPRFAKRNMQELRQSLRSKVVLMVTIATVVGGLYILLAPIFFHVLFPQYLESVNYSRFYALIILIYTPYSLLGAVLSAKLTKIPAKLLYLWNIPTVVTTLSVIVLVVPFGVSGVIGARILTAFSSACVGVYLWSRIRNLPESEISEVSSPQDTQLEMHRSIE